MDHDQEGRRYRILDVLGKGGFGTVYRAEMSSPGGFVKEVALKVVPGDLDGTSDKIARLRDEARLLGSLRHRSIVGVDALTRLGERWAVVMEYVPGVTIRDLLDRYGHLPLVVALQVAIEISSALNAAWEAQVPARTLDIKALAEGRHVTEPLRLVHRDVKPSNIQLTRNGDVKLLDFGIARSSTESVQSANVVYGSVPYLAPERLAGKDTHQADVYALALTLVQMLAGTLPRPGAPPAERRAHAAELLATVGAPPDLVTVVHAALAPEPVDRPDARTFGLALKRVLKNFTVFEPRDWAEEHVGPLIDQRKPTAGDLTGMSFTDGAVAATELFMLGKAAATFDDPIDPPPARPPDAVVQDQTTSGLVIPELPTPSVVPDSRPALGAPPAATQPPAARTRSGAWWVGVVASTVVVVGVVSIVGGAALALLAVAAGTVTGFVVAFLQ
jgi:serine/threonine protein kinase